jgi:hypothetical protein
VKNIFLCSMGGILLFTNILLAGPSRKANFEQLYGVSNEAKISNLDGVIELLKSWKGSYDLQEGSKSCKDYLEFWYDDVAAYHGMSISGKNGYGRSKDHYDTDEMTGVLTVDQILEYFNTGEDIVTIDEEVNIGDGPIDSSESTYTTEYEISHRITTFNESKIEMKMKNKYNRINFSIEKKEGKVFLEVKDRSSLIKRLKGLVQRQKIESKKCVFK